MWRGKVLALGDADAVMQLAGPSTPIVDLEGRAAIPGMNDAHAHPLLLGLQQSRLDVSPAAVSSIRDIQERIREAARRVPPERWILGGGYDERHLAEGRAPTREELDEAAPHHPVFLLRRDIHMGVANSEALRRAGIGADTPSPPGGLIERRDGRLTGLLVDNAMKLLNERIPPPTVEEMAAALAWVAREYNRYGVTSVTDAAVGLTVGSEELEAYRLAADRGELTVRATLALLADGTTTGRPTAPAIIEAGLRPGFGDGRLRLGPVKFFADGSASGRSAAFSEAYAGPHYKGLLYHTLDALKEHVWHYHRLGCQVAIHAIGDVAIEQVLDAYEYALGKLPRPDARHRIEHCGFVSSRQLRRMARLGIVPVPQPVFMYTFSETYLTYLDAEGVAGAYPMRSYLAHGLVPSASSDAPVTPVNPLLSVYAMLTRANGAGRVLKKDEALDVYEALTACTYGGAYATFEETFKGVLTPGAAADVAVLSRDVFRCSPDEMLEVAVDMTILDGHVVYDRSGVLGTGSGRE